MQDVGNRLMAVLMVEDCSRIENHALSTNIQIPVSKNILQVNNKHKHKWNSYTLNPI
jgi:hypothetical protein